MSSPSDGPSRPVRTIPRRALARHIRPVRPQVLAPTLPKAARLANAPSAQTVVEFRNLVKGAGRDSGNSTITSSTVSAQIVRRFQLL
jgi:hypothetical protein